MQFVPYKLSLLIIVHSGDYLWEESIHLDSFHGSLSLTQIIAQGTDFHLMYTGMANASQHTSYVSMPTLSSWSIHNVILTSSDCWQMPRFESANTVDRSGSIPKLPLHSSPLLSIDYVWTCILYMFYGRCGLRLLHQGCLNSSLVILVYTAKSTW